MTDHLLDTKITLPPVRQHRVVRERLLERLQYAHTLDRPHRLTLLSAPAGAGKSTLLCDWVHSYDISHIAWLSLDEQENDDTRFWRYVVAALQKCNPSLGETVLSILQAPQTAPLEGLLTALLNEINQLTEPLVLVLEDYHLIQAPSIHQALTFFLDHLPPQLHLVIATRVDPPLPLARLRASGELFEVRATDLRFTIEETQVFLHEVMGLQLLEQDVVQLTIQTEGWIAGLQLAALSLQGQEDAHRFVLAFHGNNAFVADYLTEEVLAHQSQEMRDFLMQTAILKQMNGALASAVTESEQAPALLEQARQANLFLIPLDDERQWYRYHHLFADLLRARLRLRQPTLLPFLYTRVIDWCEHNNRLHEAIEYALAGQQFERAGQLLSSDSAASLLIGGEHATVLRWLETLPEQVIQMHADLSIHRAWASLLARKMQAVSLSLASALRSIQADAEEEAQEILGNVAGVKAYIARYSGQLPVAIDLSLQALKHLESVPERAHVSRAAIGVNLGHAYAEVGEIIEADRLFTQVIHGALTHRNTYIALSALCSHAKAQTLQGQLLQAEESYVQALDLGPRHLGRHLPGEAAAYIGLGEIRFEWNRCAVALELVMKGLELAELAGDIDALYNGSITLAHVHSAKGEVEEAFAWLRRAEGCVGMTPNYLASIAAYEARYRLELGQVASVVQWVQECSLHADDQPSYGRELEYVTLVRLLLVQHRATLALPLLERLLSLAETGKRMRSVVEILLLQALARQAIGQEQQALILLAQALQLAEHQQYARVFLDEGAPVATLLRRVASMPHVSSAYAHSLQAQFPAAPIERTAKGGRQMQMPLRQLSKREGEVLRLVAAGLSNQEVAQRLSVTSGAIKKHLNTIYGKLGVSNRTQAAASARELGLL